FWTPPFTTALVYNAAARHAVRSSSPCMPAGGALIVTPSAALLDWFIGAVPDGQWGGSPGEETPVVETSWAAWGPCLSVTRLHAQRELTATSTADRNLAWETDWELHTPEMDWSPARLCWWMWTAPPVRSRRCRALLLHSAGGM
ncbi:MAG: hypothetical protein NTV22_06340, partial [bacterium]|nr:hypothetical protein [bacterium]